MLVFQEWVSGGTGVNFMQEFGSSPANANGRLTGRVEGLDSWYPPAAQTYLFAIRGSLADGQSEAELESIIESAMQALRDALIETLDDTDDHPDTY